MIRCLTILSKNPYHLVLQGDIVSKGWYFCLLYQAVKALDLGTELEKPAAILITLFMAPFVDIFSIQLSTVRCMTWAKQETLASSGSDVTALRMLLPRSEVTKQRRLLRALMPAFAICWRSCLLTTGPVDYVQVYSAWYLNFCIK